MVDHRGASAFNVEWLKTLHPKGWKRASGKPGTPKAHCPAHLTAYLGLRLPSQEVCCSARFGWVQKTPAQVSFASSFSCSSGS